MLLLSGRIVFTLDQWSAVGLASDLQDDRSFDQAVEERHRQRAIHEILSPFVEVYVGHQSGGAFLVARCDDLVEQVRRLRALGPFDAVETEFVNN